MKKVFVSVALASLAAGAPSGVEVTTQKELTATGHSLAQKGSRFASKQFTRYGNHYTMLAYREKTGSSEVHEHEADFFVIESGSATLLSGGKLVNPRAEKSGEIRGTSIAGGVRQELGAGDVVHIPAGTPHQVLLESRKPLTYFVVKVTGQ